ncbi:unnamed protein product [Toxocara canis]|uniref:Uncharacterized protein n=1 Tax=Toxocara canis TaxID=6265 RepID=A0A183V8V1_TOXCA|nr:unnamed protein product [Toxocara canis]
MARDLKANSSFAVFITTLGKLGKPHHWPEMNAAAVNCSAGSAWCTNLSTPDATERLAGATAPVISALDAEATATAVTAAVAMGTELAFPSATVPDTILMEAATELHLTDTPTENKPANRLNIATTDCWSN